MSTWIQISERLPTREETNGHDNVWAVDERGTHWIWDYVMMPISRFAHPPIAWHAYPRYTPPKPVGPDEVTVSVWPDGAMSLMHGHPPAVQVRYLRADLAARQVGPTLHECSDCNKLITERDHAEQMADKLADHIADLCDIEIGEHSSGNCPWSNALEAKPVARKVRRLTSDERQKLHEADTWCDLDSAFIAIMAARGIEVGE